ncbi:unnamed protein product [Durusdinium trenchii]|uniref:Uncharacterized protein n=2 Tax=Durusdinium trenchii TaxID=1381693 RepID=A0ABP0IPV7_9DINO
MARISQQSLADALQAIHQVGGHAATDPQSLDETLLLVRNRIRIGETNGSLEQQRQGLLHCLRPLWSFVMALQLPPMTEDMRADLIWNLYASSVARTQMASAFRFVRANLRGGMAPSATELALSVASSGMATSQHLWRGVDLTSLHARRCSGQVLVAETDILSQWLETPQSLTLIPRLEENLRQQLIAACTSVTLSMPSAQLSLEELQLDGVYQAGRIWGSLHGSGKI